MTRLIPISRNSLDHIQLKRSVGSLSHGDRKILYSALVHRKRASAGTSNVPSLDLLARWVAGFRVRAAPSPPERAVLINLSYAAIALSVSEGLLRDYDAM
ncbi:hypothetical protein AbraIFM66951_008755 [Aspergillus brasiliensis]|uniref:Uncharacterized protein n=1 Tax=Aspergillus brasiliensis TaxID=319629 RepID=A0A9W5YQL3_9EURO|nr:hypothetical protein AbraCBS73388_007695 [Aspergillus brasiliensis]GKZ45887.1 hypothetical protein AbraIFM66951_008755 [Aspergillus brasiliensis]